MASCDGMVVKFLDLSKLWSWKYGRKRKKNEKIDMYDFPVHDSSACCGPEHHTLIDILRTMFSLFFIYNRIKNEHQL